MILIGLTGDIGSGKTTLADLLAKQSTKSVHWESSSIIIEVANQLRTQPMSQDDLYEINLWLLRLPEILQHVVHVHCPLDTVQITREKIDKHPELYEKLFEYMDNPTFFEEYMERQTIPITTENKEEFRPLLQWLGGYLAKTISGDIWYAEIVRRIQLTGDVELATVGGVRFPADAAVITENGGHIVHVVRPNQGTQDGTDITERERRLIQPDITVYNNGALKQLSACAEALYADLKTGTVHKEYFASKH